MPPNIVKQGLQDLSARMRALGNMQDEYKGLAMYSKMSRPIQKCFLMFFMQEYKMPLSIIFIDAKLQKITWYNKPEFYISGMAIICIAETHYVFIHKNKNITIFNPFLDHHKDISQDLLDILHNMDIFDESYDINFERSALQQHHQKGQCLLISLLHLLHHRKKPSIKNAETLRLQLGTYVCEELESKICTPTDLAARFDEYTSSCEKIVYVLC
jgi:hypothetical protein